MIILLANLVVGPSSALSFGVFPPLIDRHNQREVAVAMLISDPGRCSDESTPTTLRHGVGIMHWTVDYIKTKVAEYWLCISYFLKYCSVSIRLSRHDGSSTRPRRGIG